MIKPNLKNNKNKTLATVKLKLYGNKNTTLEYNKNKNLRNMGFNRGIKKE